MADVLNNFLLSVFPVALMFFLGFALGQRGTFANRYDGETGAVAMSILWSMVISVLVIPVLIAI